MKLRGNADVWLNERCTGINRFIENMVQNFCFAWLVERILNLSDLVFNFDDIVQGKQKMLSSNSSIKNFLSSYGKMENSFIYTELMKSTCMKHWLVNLANISNINERIHLKPAIFVKEKVFNLNTWGVLFL